MQDGRGLPKTVPSVETGGQSVSGCWGPQGGEGELGFGSDEFQFAMKEKF